MPDLLLTTIVIGVEVAPVIKLSVGVEVAVTTTLPRIEGFQVHVTV